MNPFVTTSFLVIFSLLSLNGQCADPPSGVRVIRDLAYVESGHDRHKLDLYLPEKRAVPSAKQTGLPEDQSAVLPLVIWVHGGGWSGGSKNNPPALYLSTKGFAVASINYRLSQHAIFPAQIHDCKAAVRWLRAHAKEYGLDKNHFGVWGSSAGGHLVALMGTTNGNRELEGSLGVTTESSNVQAVVDWYGPTNFLTVGSKQTRTNLLGGDPLEIREKAQLASPLFHVSAAAVPHLIMHGDADMTVPIAQSETYADALQKAGADATLVIVQRAGHGGGAFRDASTRDRVEEFFSKHLQRPSLEERANP